MIKQSNPKRNPGQRKLTQVGLKHEVIHGDCLKVIKSMKSESINCIITSPPYWGQREYDVSPKYKTRLIGSELSPEQYVANLCDIFHEARRVLTKNGSLWLNIGDKYVNKNKVGLPFMVAMALKNDGWILRDDIIWNKMKGTQSSKDRTRGLHEYIFHFVKSPKYYYAQERILVKNEKKPKMIKGVMVSATGVSGVTYREKIKKSDLTASEKRAAVKVLEDTIKEMKDGKIIDFRMTIRGKQRTYHGSKSTESGRAKELEQKGYFIIKMQSKGHSPSSVWNIVPEDTWRTDAHCAVFPVELLRVPINATCPPGGTVLDPFMGTGTTLLAAKQFGVNGVGIDISADYIKTSRSRLSSS